VGQDLAHAFLAGTDAGQVWRGLMAFFGDFLAVAKVRAWVEPPAP